MDRIKSRLHLINTSQTLSMPFRFAGNIKDTGVYSDSYTIIKIPHFNEDKFYKMFNIYDLIATNQPIESMVEEYKDILYCYILNKKCYDSFDI